jgi:membrane-associated phospholipid phosphatase
VRATGRGLIGAGAAAGAALAVGALTAGRRGRPLDDALYRVIDRGSGPISDAFFKGVTELGSIWASAGAALSLSAGGQRREALDAFGAAGAMWFLGQGLKKAVRRPRPYSVLEGIRLLIDRPRGTSWPSSHPAVLLAFVTVACRDLGLSRGPRIAVAGLAGVVGTSRVYLGVHYPADVVSGLLFGRAVADAWTTLASPRILGRAPSADVAGTLGR